MYYAVLHCKVLDYRVLNCKVLYWDAGCFDNPASKYFSINLLDFATQLASGKETKELVFGEEERGKRRKMVDEVIN